MFKELFTEGVTFGQETSGSQAYWDAMSGHHKKNMQELFAIKKKFKGKGDPEIFQPSGVANDGYKMVLYTSKDKKHTISITYYSPRSGWSIDVCWGAKNGHCNSSSGVDITTLSVSSVDAGLQKLADKFVEMSTDDSRWGKGKYFPVKFPAAFEKRRTDV